MSKDPRINRVTEHVARALEQLDCCLPDLEAYFDANAEMDDNALYTIKSTIISLAPLFATLYRWDTHVEDMEEEEEDKEHGAEVYYQGDRIPPEEYALFFRNEREDGNTPKIHLGCYSNPDQAASAIFNILLMFPTVPIDSIPNQIVIRDTLKDLGAFKVMNKIFTLERTDGGVS